MPNITPHVCRHTYCSNMAKSGMNPKTLQYLMGHSDISVTMNVYTHISFDDAEEELKRMEEFRKAQAEIEKKEKRQKEGIQAKKDRGEWSDYGRPKVMALEDFAKEYQKVRNGELKPFELMHQLKLSKATYYRYVDIIKKSKS